jgi:Permuted papain-like amidase enzyme, YaeF/YiiX, C92 family
MIDRRSLITALALLPVSSSVIRAFAQSVPPAQETPRHPDWTTFQSGDFLWPARPDEVIVRSLAGAAPRALPADAEIEWQKERDAALNELRASADAAMRARADALAAITFKQFQAQYFENIQPGEQKTRGLGTSAGRLSVGHVAILDLDADGAPWVLEATPSTTRRYEVAYTRFPKGVVRTSYDDWIEAHSEYKVWHGRVRDKGAADRIKIADIARQFVGRDYWFWSLDLADDKAFYCSKLVWLSATRALGVPLDGDAQTDRSFWFTPKSIMSLPAVQMLHVPGPYGG